MKLKEKLQFKMVSKFLKEYDKQKGSMYFPKFLKAYSANDEKAVKAILDEVKGELNL